MRPLLIALAVLLSAGAAGTGLVACATFEEVEGVPDPNNWSYFQGSRDEVAEAARRALSFSGYTVEAIGDGSGNAILLTITSTPPGAGLREIRIEPIDVRDYRARAQSVPPGRRLPRSLEQRIASEL